MRVFVINLDRASERMQRMSARLLGLNFERLSAVDGRRSDLPQAPGMQAGEVGCLLSHRKAWAAMLGAGDPFVCVLEDDAELSPDFAEYVREADWLPADFDVIKLDTGFDRVFLERDTLPARSRVLHRLRSEHMGAAAYIVSERGAKRLLAATEGLSEPVDVTMFGMSGTRSMTVFQVLPALCCQEGSQSNIGEFGERHIRLRGWSRIWREIKRPYRQVRNVVMSERWRTIRTEVGFL